MTRTVAEVIALAAGHLGDPPPARAQVRVTVPGRFHGFRHVTLLAREGHLHGDGGVLVDLTFGGVYPLPEGMDPVAACERVALGLDVAA